MAQIIKHRRGSLEKLSEVTGSLQKGEIVIATGSANLTTTNGSALAFIVPESGSVQASNRFLMGSADPAIFSASTYNGMLKGVPYYASGSKTLFLLGSGGNEAINLVGNIQPFSGSVNTRLGDLEASIGGGGSGIGTRVSALEASQSFFDGTFSGSVATQFSASAASQTALSASIATTDSASAASVSALSASIATTDSASAAYAASQLSSLSSSVATSFSASAASVSSLSASIATTNSASAASVLALSTSVDTRLDALEFNDTRFATTGSNTFIGTQVITGSMYITNDLIVQGSSSLQNITASAVSIGTNTVVLNTSTPAVRFGGISVADSGSGAGASGSLFWDSLNNNWIYQHPVGGAESAMSAVLISGPKNSGSLGDEVHITPGRIMVAVGDDHIGDSIMSQSAGKITLEGGLDVTGNISSSTITGIGNVTLYSQSVDSRLDTIESSIGGGGSLGTRVANLETISASYLDFTQSYYTDSSSFDTRISASVAGYTANSASAATSFSASLASQTALSASIATTNNTQSDNIATVSASAWGAFQSASSYSGSLATSISASKAEYTSFSASAATSFSASLASQTALSASISTTNNTQTDNINTNSASAAGAFASASAYSASAATSFSASAFTATANSASAASDFNTLSGSTYTQFSASAATVTANSASAATSISASNAQIALLSASVASTTGDFSGSIFTQFSASAFTATANSASAASDFNTLSGSAYTQFSASAATATANSASAATSFSASAATATANSASAATSFSASAASQTALSASIATTNNGQTDRLGALESYSSSLKTAIELTGSNVTIQGDLLVRGTTTSVNSTTIELGDNIIELNGSGASNGGLYVKDVTSPNLATGSLIWDSTNDYWKAGVKASESKVLLATGDNVFTSSVQTALSGTFGYSDFSSSIATSFSASNASVASITGDFSSSVATSFSASAFTATANSASAATSFSASLATITANSASAASNFNTLSGSTYTQFSASAASVTANSASAATSFSASLASQTALSSSVDSRLDTLEGSGSIQGVGTSNNVSFSSVTASLNVPGGASTKRLAFRGLTDNIEFIAAPTTAGDIAQWNGTDFVMSNVIDGGSF
jgi:hypothetical protein